MRVFMTGATGFVGLNIVEALLEAGHEVTCHVRPNARRQYLDRMPVTVVTGDLLDVAGLTQAMQGAEGVIHTAGNTSCSWRDIGLLRQANGESTRSVLDAARQCGVRRLVYTSSTSTIGSTASAAFPADETRALAGWRSRSPYAQTKLAAEALLRNENQLECIVLNPAEVVGAYDHSLQWGRIVLAVAAGQLPFIPPGSGTFAPARDVAKAHVAALTRGDPGERHILGGHHLRFSDFISTVAAITGSPVAPADTRPYFLQCVQARLQEWLLPLRLQPPAVDAYRMRVFGGHHLFDDRKARKQLGYTVTPIQDAIRECFSWYQQNGFLPAGAPGDASAA